MIVDPGEPKGAFVDRLLGNVGGRQTLDVAGSGDDLSIAVLDERQQTVAVTAERAANSVTTAPVSPSNVVNSTS